MSIHDDRNGQRHDRFAPGNRLASLIDGPDASQEKLTRHWRQHGRDDCPRSRASHSQAHLFIEPGQHGATTGPHDSVHREPPPAHQHVHPSRHRRPAGRDGSSIVQRRVPRLAGYRATRRVWVEFPDEPRPFRGRRAVQASGQRRLHEERVHPTSRRGWMALQERQPGQADWRRGRKGEDRRTTRHEGPDDHVPSRRDAEGPTRRGHRIQSLGR